MPALIFRTTFTIGLIGLGAGVAYADLTPDDVWADYRYYLAGSMENLTADVTRTGDGLRIRNISGSVSSQGSTTQLSGLPEMLMTAMGDGSVAIKMSGDAPMLIAGEAASGDSYSIAVDVDFSGQQMQATGAPGDILYSYSMDTVSMTLAQFEATGEDTEILDRIEARMTVGALSGTTHSQGGTPHVYNQEFQAETLTYLMRVPNTETENSGPISISGNLAGLRGDSEGTLPADAAGAGGMFAPGQSAQARFTTGPGETLITADTENGPMRYSSRSDAGMFDLAMTPENARYGASSSGAHIELESGEIPFPVILDLPQARFNVSMPLATAETAQPFDLSFELAGVTLGETLWSFIDPGSHLPRVPASLSADIGGTAIVTQPVADAAQGNAMPFNVTALDLRTLLLDALGAQFSGTGNVTLPQEGMPGVFQMPVGTADLRLTGANALLANLQKANLLPANMMMGAQMMLGLFATQVGEDEYTSKVVAGENGTLSVNGQKIGQ